MFYGILFQPSTRLLSYFIDVVGVTVSNNQVIVEDVFDFNETILAIYIVSLPCKC